ncbi:hypothetical protein [Blastopirellula marina]|uniref:Peptidase MA-like domain-containing protein n=1 Tax=Blastopirellula marina TaxID=124 RepID=A0A2S8GMB3_9BACT|nr:hypothetical protein [Blastopirellula marina]PQO45562.1 hypothetical protein C5Y93_14060 [Blastopirellula marina]
MSMDARVIRRASVTLFVWTLLLSAAAAAQVRSANFLVKADDPRLAQQVLQLAEQYRSQMAKDWLGHELPRWSAPCPIEVRVGGGAGGQTSFSFDRGVPFNWQMEIFGPRDRILDSVLPHEILHTIFATHYGCALPRWADEGACTTVEHFSEKDKNTQILYRCLKTDRGIAFNQMFQMKEYPADILPLYAQGYSLARFLIGQGGKQKYVQYVGEGMRTNNWTATTQKFYGHPSLSSLQVSWLSWVRDGSNEGIIGNYTPKLIVANQQPRRAAVVRGQSPQAAPIEVASAREEQSRTSRQDNVKLTGPVRPAGYQQDITPSEPGVSGGFYSNGGRAASGDEEIRTSALPSEPRQQIRPVRVIPASTGPTNAPTYYLPGGTTLFRR